MPVEQDPYSVCIDRSAPRLSALQYLVATGIGLAVTIAATVTVLAFLFGAIVAFQGRSMPSPVDLKTVLDGFHLVVIVTTGLLILAGSIAMGVFSMMRVLRVQRGVAEAMMRRMELRDQLRSLRESLSQKQVRQFGNELEPSETVADSTVHGPIPGLENSHR